MSTTCKLFPAVHNYAINLLEIIKVYVFICSLVRGQLMSGII